MNISHAYHFDAIILSFSPKPKQTCDEVHEDCFFLKEKTDMLECLRIYRVFNKCDILIDNNIL